MTQFEALAKELIGEAQVDKNGMYTGMTKALAVMTNEVILSDDEEVFGLPWEQQCEMIKNRFYKTFPYMAK